MAGMVITHVEAPAPSRWVATAGATMAVTHRASRSTRITRIIACAKTLLIAHTTAVRRLVQTITGEQGTVSVACLPSIAATILPSALTTLRSARPGVRITVQDVHLENIIDVVLDGEGELGIGTTTAAPEGLDARRFGNDEFYCACPPDHDLAAQTSVEWSQLAEHPFVSFDRATSIGRIVDGKLETEGITPPHITHVHHIGAAAGLIAAGLGVSAVPGRLQPLMACTPVRFVPLRPILRREFCFLTRRGEELSPLAKDLMSPVLHHATRTE